MSGAGDMPSWVGSFAECFEPISKATSELAGQVMSSFRHRHLPPVMLEAYKSGTAMVDGIDPVYLGAGAGAVVISGFLVLACGCRAMPRKAKSKTSGSRGRRKPKSSKSKSATGNGVPHENDDGRAVEGAATTAPTKGGKVNGAGPRGVSVKSNAVRGGAAGPPQGAPAEKPMRPKVAEKPALGVGVPQSQGKSKRKTAADAPPVITEEIEGAKKRTRKKKPTKSAPAVVPPPKKNSTKGSSANGSSPPGTGGTRSDQSTGDSAGIESRRGSKGGGSGGNGDWQKRFMSPPEGEWETVSHKKSKPRKDKTSAAAANDANVIPGGLGL